MSCENPIIVVNKEFTGIAICYLCLCESFQLIMHLKNGLFLLVCVFLLLIEVRPSALNLHSSCVFCSISCTVLLIMV